VRGQRALGLLLALGLVACPHASDGSAQVAAKEPASALRLIGRFDRSDALHPRFAWPGSAVATRFTGSGLHVRLRATGFDQLEVVIDGAPTRVLALAPGREDYEVAAGLPAGPHELWLEKRTEARIGEVELLGFDPAGALIPPGGAPDRRIELVGDSITAGYGLEGVGPVCKGSRVAADDEFLSYGALAARELGAEHVTLAWAGRTTEQMSELYERTLPGRPESRWDFSAWTPDVVVVNLGTNDFNHGDPGQGAFTRPYVAFVHKVRARYPRAFIVCALGSMLTDSYPPGAHALTRARAYITQIVSGLRAAGDDRVTFLEFSSQDFANGLGCDYHPSLKTHRLMGDKLTSTLRTLLGW
jgi:lysophospholipase L1-like esterase